MTFAGALHALTEKNRYAIVGLERGYRMGRGGRPWAHVSQWLYNSVGRVGIRRGRDPYQVVPGLIDAVGRGGVRCGASERTATVGRIHVDGAPFFFDHWPEQEVGSGTEG